MFVACTLGGERNARDTLQVWKAVFVECTLKLNSAVCCIALVMQEGCQTFTGCHLCFVDKVTNTDDALKKIVQTLEVDGRPVGSSVAIWRYLSGDMAIGH